MRRNTDFNQLAMNEQLRNKSRLDLATGEINQNTEHMPTGLFGISKQNMIVYRIKVVVYIAIPLTIIYLIFF